VASEVRTLAVSITEKVNWQKNAVAHVLPEIEILELLEKSRSICAALTSE
jgi:hypothetical protein